MIKTMIEDTSLLKALESGSEKARERLQDHPFIFNARSLNHYQESILAGIELTTRRFDALKLWLTLRTMGADRIGEAFDRVVHLAKQTYLLFLSEPTIEVIHQPQLSTLVFRYRPSRQHPDHEIDEANAYIRKALFRSGEAVVAGTKVQNRQYLKFTLLNPTTTIHDIQAILRLIKRHGQHYFRLPEQPPRQRSYQATRQGLMMEVGDA